MKTSKAQLAAVKKWQRANPEKQAQYVRAWEKKNPEQAQARKNAWAKSAAGKKWLAANQKKKNKARDAWRKKKRRETKRALRRSNVCMSHGGHKLRTNLHDGNAPAVVLHAVVRAQKPTTK